MSSQIVPQGYKQTKAGVIPEDWDVLRINEFAKVETGKTPLRSNSIFWENGTINWATTTEVNDTYIISTNEKITLEAVERLKMKVLPINTILMAMYGQGKTRGKVALLKIESTINQAFATIKPNKNYSTNYVFSYLNKSYMKIRNLSNGGSQDNLNLDIIKSIRIPLPPLKEQEKIAKILTTWDDAISTQTKLIKAKEELKKGLMQKLLSGEVRFDGFFDEWEEVKLGEILKSNRLGGNYQNSLEISNNPLIKMGNINRGQINIKKIEYISDKEHIDNNHLIKYGDLFFNTRNTLDLVGKVAIWKNELDRAFYNSNLMKLVFNEKIESNFFMNYLFNTEKILAKLKSYATGTTSVAAIYTRDLLTLKIKLPSLPEQQKIAEVLSNADKEIDLLKTELQELKEQKKGLMQKLLTGKVRVNV